MFKDTGDRLVMDKRTPVIDHVATAMTLATEKFGILNISGTKEFKQQVIDIAITKDLNVVFSSSKMQSMFVEQREAYKEKNQETIKEKELENEIKKGENEAPIFKNESKDVEKKEEVKPETFDVKYTWLKDDDRMIVSINGKKPTAIPLDTLNKIMANDAFLSQYSLENVQSGKLDMNLSNGKLHVSKQFDEQGKVVHQQESAQSNKMTL